MWYPGSGVVLDLSFPDLYRLLYNECNHSFPSQHTVSGHHRLISQTPFRWRVDGSPFKIFTGSIVGYMAGVCPGGYVTLSDNMPACYKCRHQVI